VAMEHELGVAIRDQADSLAVRPAPSGGDLRALEGRRRRRVVATLVAAATVAATGTTLWITNDSAEEPSAVDTATPSPEAISPVSEPPSLADGPQCGQGASLATGDYEPIEAPPNPSTTPEELGRSFTSPGESVLVDERRTGERATVGIVRPDQSLRAVLDISYRPQWSSWVLDSAVWCDGEPLRPA